MQEVSQPTQEPVFPVQGSLSSSSKWCVSGSMSLTSPQECNHQQESRVPTEWRKAGQQRQNKCLSREIYRTHPSFQNKNLRVTFQSSSMIAIVYSFDRGSANKRMKSMCR